ncbi:5-formyltetrahydrofolate cyclo-ligase [Eurytemora carolleeae]|uniref:5-formyltetrahydrofolate cyclo-ligase n=1 Tax=Eurytemora carolleeae TaxID=1294199 RepID=UPI000C77780F|nr:5-formyltetrahydrofolate cyclo-ligase [Eurytemora carolleeae]|eukprot:XP_023331821.1 5-formyltetrahydrofolate cyclo-ligase-like [Eurytemora affinis]
MKDEISTTAILQHSLRSGKKCFIPQYFKGGSRMKMVELKDWEDYLALPLTSWNIRQPADVDIRPDAGQTGGLDLVLVPGLAFSSQGDRCGRGKGYYDTYLQNLTKTQAVPPMTVGLGFKEQIVENLPMDKHDFKIDVVISP